MYGCFRRPCLTSLALVTVLVLGGVLPVLADDDEETVNVQGDVLPSLLFEVSTASINFGNVQPTGTTNGFTSVVLDPANPSSGACYVANAKVDFAIRSNAPWDGDVWADPGDLHTAGLPVSDLVWSEDIVPPFNSLTYSRCEMATPFVAEPGEDDWITGGPSPTIFEDDNEYALFVDWADDAGVIDIDVTYEVSTV